MRRGSLVLMLVAACLVFTVATKAAKLPPGHSLVGPALPGDAVRLSIVLKPTNENEEGQRELERRVLDRANPSSPRYGQWLTLEEVRGLTAAAPGAALRVRRWLLAHGINERGVRDFGDALRVDTTVERASALLGGGAQFGRYARRVGDVRAILHHEEALQWPSHLPIAFIATVGDFPPRPSRPAGQKPAAASPLNPTLVPLTLRNMYGLPGVDELLSHNASIGLAEFQNYGGFGPNDLTVFHQENDQPVQHVDHVVGSTEGEGLESVLDVQYATSVALGADSWYWQVDDWLLELVQDLIAAPARPAVVSVSWGWAEHAQCEIEKNCTHLRMDDAAYVAQVNRELARLTGMGTTVLVASGDDGVAGKTNSGCATKPVAQAFNPIFPGGSPWVLSVGATMFEHLAAGRVVSHQRLPPMCHHGLINHHCTDGVGRHEQVASTPHAIITSGGGFTLATPRPAWQHDAVEAYLAAADGLPPPEFFNKTNRGYPDVAAAGHHYLVKEGGLTSAVDGTSASTPVVAGMVAWLNDVRAGQGRGTLGFLNPLLYKLAAQSPGVFTDITQGNNRCTQLLQCCMKEGFPAAPGWDAASGLGTINYRELLKAVKALPQ